MRTSKRMEESCKVCKKWQNHFYWNHMEPTNMKLFVKMEASFKRHLNLPRKFAENFKGKLRKVVNVKLTSGKTWKIEVLKSDNTLSLRSGWRNFVTANKIDQNDSLVFKYTGNSSFDVFVFDSSGNEKAFLPIIKIEESETETKQESESDSESDTEKTSSNSGTSIHIFAPSNKIKSDSQTSSSHIRPGTNGNRLRSIHSSKQMKQTLSDKPYYVSSELELSVRQKRIADKLVSATQPGSKLFLKILSSTDVRYHLNIPKPFAREFLADGNHFISLQVANKNKVFSAHCNCNNKRQIIGAGWKNFALEYDLKKGDLCLFEVKNSDSAGRLAVVVHVPRA